MKVRNVPEVCDLVDSQASMAVPRFPEDPYSLHDVLDMAVHVNTADLSCSGDFCSKCPSCSWELALGGLSLCRHGNNVLTLQETGSSSEQKVNTLYFPGPCRLMLPYCTLGSSLKDVEETQLKALSCRLEVQFSCSCCHAAISPYTMWVPVTKLSSSGLVASYLRDIYVSPHFEPLVLSLLP